MKAIRKRFLWVGLLLLSWTAILRADSNDPLPPSGLLTDLLERTETVWIDGFPSNMTLADLPTAIERTQIAEIRSKRPTFSWIVNDRRRGVTQTAYEIQVASNPDLFADGNGKPDVWTSGTIASGKSSSVPYDGEPLVPNTVYYWRVRTQNNGDESDWSAIRGFKTAAVLAGDETLRPEEIFSGGEKSPHLPEDVTSRYPIVFDLDSPVSTEMFANGVTFFDFGRASFGRLQVTLTSSPSLDGAEGKGDEPVALVRLGERIKDGRVDRNPAGSTRYWEYRLPLLAGTQTYQIKTRIDSRNSSGAAVLIPGYIGEVMPFRYAEIEIIGAESTAETATKAESTTAPSDTAPSVIDKIDPTKKSAVTIGAVSRLSAHYPFNQAASFFHCDNEALNQVWELCRYSIKATSFAGIYVDGDRERIPYEGDALLNQLSHYSVDREFSLARYSQDYLIFHPTWPTEWILQSVQMAWYDYLYTGDDRNIRRRYDDLKAKTFLALAEDDGLIGTRSEKMTREVLDSIHFSGGEIRDIVDWPHEGLAGNENMESGETDGFVFCDKNVVVNAYHLFALRSILHFAEILGKTEDAAFFRGQIKKARSSFERVFFDSQTGVYRDGDATDHASLHGNMFPLAFGLVPPDYQRSVTDFVRSRGMRCSVYGAQFLLDALYEGGDGETALARMTDDGLRGWLNMIRVGSTISLEAWDDRYKPNQDWNHAWGAAPANMIPRKLVGVEPLAPAFAEMRIKPQVASLTEVTGVVPTIRGSVRVAVQRLPERYSLTVTIPANTQAEVWLPVGGNGDDTLTVDGQKARDVFPDFVQDGDFWKFPHVGSGRYVFVRE